MFIWYLFNWNIFDIKMSSARHAEIDSVLNELRKQRLNDEQIHLTEQKRLNEILLFCQRINEQTSINSNGNNLKDQTQQDGEQSEEEQSKFSFNSNNLFYLIIDYF